MKNKRDEEILATFMEMTKAEPYEATPEELAQIEELREHERRGEIHRQAQKRLEEQRAREKALLEQAKSVVS